MAKANDRQVGGGHYKKGGEEHWDRMWRLHGRGYFVGCITKYVERYHEKNGVQDLEKAIHFIEKLIELETDAAGCRTEADGSCTGKSDCMHSPLDEVSSVDVQQEVKNQIAAGFRTPSVLFADPILSGTDQRNLRYWVNGPSLSVYKHGEVLPTGWAQFVFEGADQEGYLYTCRECNAHFRAPPYSNPHMAHPCHFIADCAAGVVGAQVDEGAPTSAYVNQG